MLLHNYTVQLTEAGNETKLVQLVSSCLHSTVWLLFADNNALDLMSHIERTFQFRMDAL